MAGRFFWRGSAPLGTRTVRLGTSVARREAAGAGKDRRESVCWAGGSLAGQSRGDPPVAIGRLPPVLPGSLLGLRGRERKWRREGGAEGGRLLSSEARLCSAPFLRLSQGPEADTTTTKAPAGRASRHGFQNAKSLSSEWFRLEPGKAQELGR